MNEYKRVNFISKLHEIVQQLSDLGEVISEKMLMSLPLSLNHFQSAWESTADSKKTLNELPTRLMIEETRSNIQELPVARVKRHFSPSDLNRVKKKKMTKSKGHVDENAIDVGQSNFCEKNNL